MQKYFIYKMNIEILIYLLIKSIKFIIFNANYVTNMDVNQIWFYANNVNKIYVLIVKIKILYNVSNVRENNVINVLLKLNVIINVFNVKIIIKMFKIDYIIKII